MNVVSFPAIPVSYEHLPSYTEIDSFKKEAKSQAEITLKKISSDFFCRNYNSSNSA